MADGSVTIDTKLNNDGFKSGLGKLGSIAKTGLKTVAAATGVVASAFAGIVTASVNARGEIEQSLGGVETLFKDSADKVIKNANNAFKTAGMSANEYMQNVTSFSASLLQSVAGDTNKAADIADMAMTDMSDNANKMGTSMEAITDAYQGFAKQNYTMLDNLKLGYGGTKTEMERLLADAQKITGIKYDINNLSDVYEAIHVIQGELGITGTTAKEASETLQGSFSAMKASWNNFLSGAGDLSQVVDTATDVVKNVVRIVNEAIPDIVSSISKSLPELLELGGEILQQLIQGIITYLPELMNSAGQILSSLAQGIAQMLPTLIPEAVNCIVTLVEGLLDNIDQLIDAGIQLIIGLAEGLINALPTLIEKIPVIIEKLINAIVRNLPKIVEAGIKLVVMLAKGLIQAIPQLLSKIPEIIGAIVKGLGEGVSKVAEVGKNIIQGLWNGISNMRKLDSKKN